MAFWKKICLNLEKQPLGIKRIGVIIQLLSISLDDRSQSQDRKVRGFQKEGIRRVGILGLIWRRRKDRKQEVLLIRKGIWKALFHRYLKFNYISILYRSSKVKTCLKLVKIIKNHQKDWNRAVLEPPESSSTRTNVKEHLKIGRLVLKSGTIPDQSVIIKAVWMRKNVVMGWVILKLQ